MVFYGLEVKCERELVLDGAGVRSHTVPTVLKSLEFILKARRIQVTLINTYICS